MDLSAEFNPARLTLARMRRGLTVTALAEALGVSRRTVGAWESSRSEPDRAHVQALAEALGFPPQFFVRDDPDSLSQARVSFRALTKMKAATRDSALAAGTLAIELDARLGDMFNLPASDVPDYAGLAPKTAAIAARQAWGLSDGPIRDMLRLLELHGVRVYSLTRESREVGAYSFFAGESPFVMLNTIGTPFGMRLDAAHELGHLVLHRLVETCGSREAENEADEFAEEFMVPAASLERTAPKTPTCDDVIALAQGWGVPPLRMAKLLNRVGRLSDWRYRAVCIELTRLGAHQRDLCASHRETSLVLKQALAMLRSGRQSFAALAASIGVYPEDLQAITFNLTMLGVEGEGRGGDGRKAKLSLVR